ncbi:MAG: hypothetical protein ACLRTA_02280 [Clostridia bacterium]
MMAKRIPTILPELI